MKTADLTGAALDWAVAKCEGVTVWYDDLPQVLRTTKGLEKEYSPSDNWAQGGPIIEREGISVEYNRAEFTWLWTAYKLGDPHEDNPEGGPTPLIAAMRCYVASKLGAEVEIPEELKE
jgi:hypothetical protein